MSKGNKENTIREHFTNENWDRWTNGERLKFMRHFRDKLRAKNDRLARKLGLPLSRLQQLDADIIAMQAVVAAEAARNN